MDKKRHQQNVFDVSEIGHSSGLYFVQPYSDIVTKKSIIEEGGEKKENVGKLRDDL